MPFPWEQLLVCFLKDPDAGLFTPFSEEKNHPILLHLLPNKFWGQICANALPSASDDVDPKGVLEKHLKSLGVMGLEPLISSAPAVTDGIDFKPSYTPHTETWKHVLKGGDHCRAYYAPYESADPCQITKVFLDPHGKRGKLILLATHNITTILQLY